MGLTFIEMSGIKNGKLTLIPTLRVAKFIKEVILLVLNLLTIEFHILTENIATHMEYYEIE